LLKLADISSPSSVVYVRDNKAKQTNQDFPVV